MYWPSIAGTTARIGVTEFDAVQQHPGRRPAPSGIDVQAADAWPAASDAPTNAAMAIHEKRSLVKVIGMALSRDVLQSAVDGDWIPNPRRSEPPRQADAPT